MIQYRTEQNLTDVVAFQKYFVLAVCNALESRFKDNHIITVFKILGLTNMPSRLVGLANWRIVGLELLCGQYGVEGEIRGRKIPSINKFYCNREIVFCI